MQRNIVTWRAIVPIARWAAALVLVWLGSLLAFGTMLLASWADHPWPGEQRSGAGMVAYTALTVCLLAGPAAAWWFLLPRYRWWGIPVMAVVALATFAAFGVF